MVRSVNKNSILISLSLLLSVFLTGCLPGNKIRGFIGDEASVEPASVASVTVTNSSPTNDEVYALTFGTISGDPSQYCILENDTDEDHCTWLSAPLPTDYTVNPVNDLKTLSVWVKNSAGEISARVDANAVRLDTEGPVWPNSIGTTPTSNINIMPTLTFTSDAVDAGSGVLKYQFAIGTSTSGSAASDVMAWADTTSNSMAGLPMTGADNLTTYYLNMRAIDNLGNISAINSSTAWKVYLEILPVYADNGVDWNTYVKNDGADVYSGSDTICAGTETKYDDCIHAGELRKVVVNGASSCAGLTMTDDLGVFNWECLVKGGVATFFSAKFQKNKGLKDLINASSWKNISTALSVNSVPRNTSTLDLEWSNPITPVPVNSATTVAALNTAGTIYTVATSTTTRGYNLDADGVGLVIFSGQTLSLAGGSTANSNETTGEIGATRIRVVASGSQKHIWLEGKLSGGYNALHMGLTKFSILHNVELTGSSDTGAMLETFVANRVRNLHSYSNGYGIEAGWYGGSNYNLYEDVVIRNNAGNGFLVGGTNNVFVRFIGVQNAGYGIGLGGTANLVYQARVSNNGASGIHIAGGTYSKIVETISNNNAAIGINLTNSGGGSVGTIVSRSVAAYNGSAGLTANHGTATMHNVISKSNSSGFDKTSGTGADSFSHMLFSANTGTEISIGTGTPIFKGNLLVEDATSCSIAGVTTITNTTCAPAGSSTATLYYVGNINNDLPTAYAYDDLENTSDTSNSATFPGTPATFDWINFKNIFRTWGKLAVGRWTAGLGFIFDFRPSLIASVIRNKIVNPTIESENFIPGAACPSQLDGSVAITASTSDPHTFLLNAGEIILDSIGNDNGLCESNEACIYTPNYGAYQGTGDLVSCTFTNGTVSNVSMYAYSQNGAEQTPASAPQWNSLMAYWRMNNNWNDSKNSNNGSPTAGATFSASALHGSHTGQFDGVDGLVEVPNHTSLNPTGNELTIMAWVNPTVIDDEEIIVEKYANDATNAQYLFSIWPDGRLVHTWHTTGGNTWGTASHNRSFSTGTVPLNQWTHVAMTRNGTRVSYYINGVLSGSSDDADALPYVTSTLTLRIGGENRGGVVRLFQGTMDEVLMWNKALTATEISQVYTQQSLN